MRLPSFVQWDRGADAGDEVVLYGWIPRKDGQRDFVLVMYAKATGANTFYATSSAKYSLALAEFYDAAESHAPCLPFAEALALLLEAQCG